MYFDNDSIICTPEHPFFVNKSWIPAKELKKGSRLFSFAGTKVVVDSVFSFRTDTETIVHNLEVKGNENYYVSASKVLVHNCNKTIHHFATNKHSKFTVKMSKIANKYGLDLDGSWNKGKLIQQGRHPNAYHEFVLEGMQKAASKAGNNKLKFLQLFDKYVKKTVLKNPQMLNKSWWVK